jgi:hypothetical protein
MAPSPGVSVIFVVEASTLTVTYSSVRDFYSNFFFVYIFSIFLLFNFQTFSLSHLFNAHILLAYYV